MGLFKCTRKIYLLVGGGSSSGEGSAVLLLLTSRCDMIQIDEGMDPPPKSLPTTACRSHLNNHETFDLRDPATGH